MDDIIHIRIKYSNLKIFGILLIFIIFTGLVIFGGTSDRYSLTEDIFFLIMIITGTAVFGGFVLELVRYLLLSIFNVPAVSLCREGVLLSAFVFKRKLLNWEDISVKKFEYTREPDWANKTGTEGHIQFLPKKKDKINKFEETFFGGLILRWITLYFGFPWFNLRCYIGGVPFLDRSIDEVYELACRLKEQDEKP